MNGKSSYVTRQQKDIRGYLETIPGVHVTAQEICEHFRAAGVAVGQTTVYRQLEKMVGSGLVNKYIVDANSPACFAYVGSQAHGGQEMCFHCKCEKCGALIHLHCRELAGIHAHLLDEHQFALNSMRTVFYGVCQQCRGGTVQEETS
ncbi:MAG: transcriptional repressor [Oscillospiraceae bacterium]|nr:transcriptional repressor [Oscillospiraceae bacterium]